MTTVTAEFGRVNTEMVCFFPLITDLCARCTVTNGGIGVLVGVDVGVAVAVAVEVGVLVAMGGGVAVGKRVEVASGVAVLVGVGVSAAPAIVAWMNALDT